MKTFFLLLFFLLPQTVPAEQGNISNEKACAAVLCLYGQSKGVIEIGEECKLVLEMYYSINQVDENNCEATKALRRQFLNSCKDNIYPTKDLVDC
ncbi:MAG: hypothetical protein GQ468_01255 [Candidatus Scalindua sp.]|nr:hypothetical protein [Candidatus Scalindua sp.]